MRVNTETRLSCGFGDWASSGDPLHGGVRRENTRASRKPAEKTVEQVCREDGEVLRGGKQRRILCVCVCVHMCVQERFLRPTCLSLIPKAPFRPRLLAPSPVFMRSNWEAPCPHIRREPQLIWPTCQTPWSCPRSAAVLLQRRRLGFISARMRITLTRALCEHWGCPQGPGSFPHRPSCGMA